MHDEKSGEIATQILIFNENQAKIYEAYFRQTRQRPQVILCVLARALTKYGGNKTVNTAVFLLNISINKKQTAKTAVRNRVGIKI